MLTLRRAPRAAASSRLVPHAPWLLAALVFLAAPVAALLLLAAPAAAQDPLDAAEAAYLEVDFDGTRDQALAALRAGGHGPGQMVRIYQLLGIASSALGDEAAARDYFMRMLGVDPDASLDESVPPRLRAPYLEARGAWAARPSRLGVEVGLDRASSAVRVQLRDPTDMARRVRVSARLEGAASYSSAEYAAASVIIAQVAGAADADRVEYFVEVLDMHGNVITARGSEFDPSVVGREGSSGAGRADGGGGASFFEEPLFWIIVGAVVLVGAGIGIAVAVDQQSRIGIQTGISIGIE